jgi:hypothetical protein
MSALLATFLSEMGAAKTGRGIHTGEKTKAKQFAIQNAHRLLNMFSKKPKIANDAEKGGKFCNLAAILFGDDNKNLSHQCQKYLDDMEKRPWLQIWRADRKRIATPKK